MGDAVRTAKLRELMNTEDVVFAPGAGNALTAKLIEHAGFKAICSSGFCVAANLGMPDAELYTMTENAETVRNMARVTTIPIIADADTGYGNAVNVIRTVRELEDAGASAIFMEDQMAPKRCPVCVTRNLNTIPLAEAVGKIRAAVDARRDPNFLIIARTDVTPDEVITRAKAYADAGADLIMPLGKNCRSLADWKAVHEACGLPLLISITSGTWVEREFTPERMVEAGIKIAIYPLHATYASVYAQMELLAQLQRTKFIPDVTVKQIDHHDFVKLIGFPEIEALQAKYLPSEDELFGA